MGALDVLKRKSGVIYADDVYNLFKYAQKNEFAIPAVNVTSSSTVVAALEAARDKKSPIILQMSQGGAAFFCGKGINNQDQDASVDGAIAGAHYIKSIAPAYGIPVILHTDHCDKKKLPWLRRMLEEDQRYYDAHPKPQEPLFSSHMIDLSAESKRENIETTCEIFRLAAKMNQFLEMEIGITGGVEDGQNNEDVKNSALYTQPEDIWEVYKAMHGIHKNFTIAAAFGNVHGVYQPGAVDLKPELLKLHQAHVKEMERLEEDKPVFLVFHGGSGSSVKHFKEAISYGVVKVNLDTDLQWAYMEGIRDYMFKNKDYLMTQLGNPEGEHKANKDYYDPRKWVREGEVTMRKRVELALEDFNTKGQVDNTSSA